MSEAKAYRHPARHGRRRRLAGVAPGHHRAIAAVTEDLASLRFNRAVAQIYTFVNAISAAREVSGAVRREALETLVLLIGPMMPHLAESCGEALGHTTFVAATPWPVADPALTASDTVTIAVQVNGKLRGTIEVAKDAAQSDAWKKPRWRSKPCARLGRQNTAPGDRGARAAS